jgi:hypothetical protein
MAGERLPASLPAGRQGFRSVASFSFGGQERASKPPQAICKPLGAICCLFIVCKTYLNPEERSEKI